MFVDSAKIKIKAGNGGNGAVAFHREKYVASGGPDGGDGGKGGDIIFVADDHLATLADFRYKRKYSAENGANGEGGRRSGKSGKSLTIKVPRGTIIKEAESGVAMLPMPYVIVAKTQVEGLETALDRGAEWKKLDPDSETVTGVIIARTEFVNEHPEAVKTFIDEYVASCKYVNENVEAAATLVEEAGIFKAAIAKQAIPFCNVTGTTGNEMKPIVEGYLNVLLGQNPNAIGGALPGDDFYYTAE